ELRGRRFYRFAVGDVGADVCRPPPESFDLAGGGLQTISAARDEADVVALARKLAHHCPADACRCSGDDCYAAHDERLLSSRPAMPATIATPIAPMIAASRRAHATCRATAGIACRSGNAPISRSGSRCPASHTTSARCSAWRSVVCAICSRHEKPSLTISVRELSSRTCGSNPSSPALTETS